jgi:hypothetical protein
MSIASIRRYFKAGQTLEPLQWSWFQASVGLAAVLIVLSHCFVIMSSAAICQAWVDMFTHVPQNLKITDWSPHDGVVAGALKLFAVVVYAIGMFCLLVGAFVMIILPWMWWTNYRKRYKPR